MKRSAFGWASRWARPSFAGLLLMVLAIPNSDGLRADDSKQDKNSAARTFIGALEGAPGNARIALVMQDGGFVAYACSQDAELNRSCSRWFTGNVEEGMVRATTDGVEL